MARALRLHTIYPIAAPMLRQFGFGAASSSVIFRNAAPLVASRMYSSVCADRAEHMGSGMQTGSWNLHTGLWKGAGLVRNQKRCMSKRVQMRSLMKKDPHAYRIQAYVDSSGQVFDAYKEGKYTYRPIYTWGGIKKRLQYFQGIFTTYMSLYTIWKQNKLWKKDLARDKYVAVNKAFTEGNEAALSGLVTSHRLEEYRKKIRDRPARQRMEWDIVGWNNSKFLQMRIAKLGMKMREDEKVPSKQLVFGQFTVHLDTMQKLDIIDTKTKKRVGGFAEDTQRVKDTLVFEKNMNEQSSDWRLLKKVQS